MLHFLEPTHSWPCIPVARTEIGAQGPSEGFGPLAEENRL